MMYGSPRQVSPIYRYSEVSEASVFINDRADRTVDLNCDEALNVFEYKTWAASIHTVLGYTYVLTLFLGCVSRRQ